jgi:putative flippase GtrA
MNAFVQMLRADGEDHSLTGLRLRGRFRVLPQISRYAVVSSLALVLDYAVYLSLTSAGMKPLLAGMIGYCLGLLLHFLLSVCFVFDASGTHKAPARLLGEFALSGLVGLAITACVIAAATDVAGLPALPAKLLATAASFLLVYLLRRTVVFAAAASKSV